eukprot:scaffold1794_cov390-Prasinococcus_capsulatus_cf.AAC.3
MSTSQQFFVRVTVMVCYYMLLWAPSAALELLRPVSARWRGVELPCLRSSCLREPNRHSYVCCPNEPGATCSLRDGLDKLGSWWTLRVTGAPYSEEAIPLLHTSMLLLGVTSQGNSSNVAHERSLVARPRAGFATPRSCKRL